MSIVIAPPFTDRELATQKVQIAEDLWNTCDPKRVAAAYAFFTAASAARCAFNFRIRSSAQAWDAVRRSAIVRRSTVP